jgi:positive regulator of sigma E activity
MQLSESDVDTWAEVTEITAKGNFVLALLEQNGSCHTGGCGASSGLGCKTNAFARLLSRAPALVLPIAHDDVHVGDRVLLRMSQHALMRLTVMAYAVPLGFMLLGMVAGQAMANDVGALCIGLFALLSSWFLIGKLTLNVSPSIVDIVHLSRNEKEIHYDIHS